MSNDTLTEKSLENLIELLKSPREYPIMFLPKTHYEIMKANGADMTNYRIYPNSISSNTFQ